MSADEAPPSAAEAGPLASQPAAVRRAIIGFAVLVTALGLAGTALSPYLLVKQPLVLVALSPDARHIVLAASQVDLLPLLAVAGPRRALAMLATYGIAGIYGYRFIRYAEGRMPRVSRAIAWLKRLFDRVGLPLLFLVPTHALSGLSGATGTPVRSFLIAIVPGQVPFILMYYFFGEAVSGLSARLVAFLSANLLESTLVCTALVLLQQVVARWRRRNVRAGDESSEGSAP